MQQVSALFIASRSQLLSIWFDICTKHKPVIYLQHRQDNELMTHILTLIDISSLMSAVDLLYYRHTVKHKIFALSLFCPFMKKSGFSLFCIRQVPIKTIYILLQNI